MKNLILHLAALFLVCLLVNCTDEIDPVTCIKVVPNSTIQQVSFSAAEKKLFVSFRTSLAYCSGDMPFQANRLDISLVNFTGSYQNIKTDKWDTVLAPPGVEPLFTGELACSDSCNFPIPTRLSYLTIRYFRQSAENIKVVLDTNGIFAAEFNIYFQ
jgi:hypothetical protein